MITLLFSCATCGLKDVECRVRARRSEEDVVKWMQGTVMRAVAQRHAALSLLCEAAEVQNLKIPIDKEDPDAWIGKQTDIVPPKGNAP